MAIVEKVYADREMNEDAMARLNCEKELKIVPGATHLFEEPGTLEKVASLAAEWFSRHLLALNTHSRSRDVY